MTTRQTQLARLLDRLPPSPPLAVELLALTAHADTKISALAALVDRDPVLSARTLKLCNSPSFGLGSQVSSIDRATVLVGIQQMKNLVLGLIAIDGAEADRSGSADAAQRMERAIVTSGGARTIAALRLPTFAGEAFVAGLVLDVGIALLQRIEPSMYQRVTQLTVVDGQRLHSAERAILGVTHMEVGQALLRNWGLPSIIHEPVGVHHCPQLYEGDVDTTQLVDIVASASEIANLFCEPDKSESMNRVRGICSGYFQLRDSEIDNLLTTIGRDARDTARAFELERADSLEFDQIRNVLIV